MNNEIGDLIDLYFDGELEKGKESVLFALLSQDEEARNYFKQMNALKTNIPFTMEEVPFNLEKKILYTVAEKNSKPLFNFGRGTVLSFASYAVTVILLILTILFFVQSNNYKNKIETVSKQIEDRNKEILLLLNSLPSVQVESKLNNEIIVKANL